MMRTIKRKNLSNIPISSCAGPEGCRDSLRPFAIPLSLNIPLCRLLGAKQMNSVFLSLFCELKPRAHLTALSPHPDQPRYQKYVDRRNV